MLEIEEISKGVQSIPASVVMKVPGSWNSSRFPVSLTHLTVTKCFLAFPVIVFYLNFISFPLIMVLFLRGISTLPRLAVCLCFAKSLTSYFLMPLSSCSSAITAAAL